MTDYTYHLQLSRGMYDIIRSPDGALMSSDLTVDQVTAVGKELANQGADVVNITFRTPKCIQCGTDTIVLLPFTEFERWRSGTLIQAAFPEMSADDREVLITGTHPGCWDDMFKSEEEILDEKREAEFGRRVDEAYDRETGK
jgi:hypothetical protein